jgi:hypothetical protein
MNAGTPPAVNLHFWPECNYLNELVHTGHDFIMEKNSREGIA